MAGTIYGTKKPDYYTQNGLISDDEIIKDILTKWDDEYGTCIVRDMDDKVLFLCDCGGEFLHKLSIGDIELKFNNPDK
jgi:hypothetical protein